MILNILDLSVSLENPPPKNMVSAQKVWEKKKKKKRFPPISQAFLYRFFPFRGMLRCQNRRVNEIYLEIEV